MMRDRRRADGFVGRFQISTGGVIRRIAPNGAHGAVGKTLPPPILVQNEELSHALKR